MTPQSIVLIHGVGLDHTMWAPLVAALDGDRNVITYDLVGHGTAAHPPGPYRLETFVAQLAEVAPAESIVVGFSLGALIAQGFASRHPKRVRRLMLLNSVFDRTPAERAAIIERVADVRNGGYPASVNAALDRWFTPEFAASHPAIIESIRSRMLDNDVTAYAHAYEVFATADEELVAGCARITCPTLVVTGADDPRSTPAMTTALAAALPDGRAVIVPGVRHMLPVERADVVAELIRRETATQ